MKKTKKKIKLNLAYYTIEEATHELIQYHRNSVSTIEYRLPCIPVGFTKQGNAKVVVFGERYKGGDMRARLLYVPPERVVEKNTSMTEGVRYDTIYN